MQKLRLFWAVNLPLEIRKKLFSAGERLREAGADAKWVEENNLHLTVKFLGDADQGMVERIAQSAAGRLRGFGKFSLDLKGTGFFPGARSPKVLWVGLGGDVNKLRALALTLEEAMESLGFPGEGRKFSPHLTLARIRSPRNVDRLAGLVQPGAAGIRRPGGLYGGVGGTDVQHAGPLRPDIPAGCVRKAGIRTSLREAAVFFNCLSYI